MANEWQGFQCEKEIEKTNNCNLVFFWEKKFKFEKEKQNKKNLFFQISFFHIDKLDIDKVILEKVMTLKWYNR